VHCCNGSPCVYALFVAPGFAALACRSALIHDTTCSSQSHRHYDRRGHLHRNSGGCNLSQLWTTHRRCDSTGEGLFTETAASCSRLQLGTEHRHCDSTGEGLFTETAASCNRLQLGRHIATATEEGPFTATAASCKHLQFGRAHRHCMLLFCPAASSSSHNGHLARRELENKH